MSYRPWLEERALRQMSGLPAGGLDVLVRALVRICEDPYDRMFSRAVRADDPHERMAELGDLGFIEFTVDDAAGLVRVLTLVWAGLPVEQDMSEVRAYAVPCATTPTLTLSWSFLCSLGRSSVFADQALDDVGALNPCGHIDHLAGLLQRLRNTVSTCRKSHARIPAAWQARNYRQVGDARPAGRLHRRSRQGAA